MDRVTLQHIPIAFERPALDQETHPARVRLPDPVRFHAWLGEAEKIVVAVTPEAVEDYLHLDRPPTWDDLDQMWDVVETAAERLIRADRFEISADDKTGLPQVMLHGDDVGA